MSIEIPLTQGKVALIDDEDYDLVKNYKWQLLKNHHNYYAIAYDRMTNGKQMPETSGL